MVWSTEKETPLWLPYIASLHYINTPKLALAYQQELGRSCPNKKGAAHHCPSSVWIWRKTINLLSSYIKPQITLPPPLKVAAQNVGSQRRVNSADSGLPCGKPARNTRRLTWQGGRGTLACGLVWLIFSTAIVFWWFLQTYLTSGPCSFWFFLAAFFYF